MRHRGDSHDRFAFLSLTVAPLLRSHACHNAPSMIDEIRDQLNEPDDHDHAEVSKEPLDLRPLRSQDEACVAKLLNSGEDRVANGFCDTDI